MDSLDKMNQFLETHTIPKLTETKMEALNRPITMEKVESVRKPPQKGIFSTGQRKVKDFSLVNSTKHVKN